MTTCTHPRTEVIYVPDGTDGDVEGVRVCCDCGLENP